ncbi:MAG TPA: hypothetical protein VKU44_12220, partial [Terriglobia bacterium]|nr:hypothetical protein [Terriglobia bacterium]
AGADGRFHVFWIDNRSGVAQIYTAAVTVVGRPSTVGAPELTGLENVSKLIELQYTKSVFDPRARTLVLEFQMLNTSHHAIEGPLKLRMLAMTSDVGPPAVVVDNEHSLGPGAVVDISSAVPAGGLLPGQISAVSQLTLRFSPGDVVLNPRGNTEIAHMRARVFGKIRK